MTPEDKVKTRGNALRKLQDLQDVASEPGLRLVGSGGEYGTHWGPPEDDDPVDDPMTAGGGRIRSRASRTPAWRSHFNRSRRV